MAKKTSKITKLRRPPLYIPVEKFFLDPENPRLPEEVQGASESVAWKLRKEGKPVNMDAIWAEQREKVKKGLFKSKAPIEDIGQYIT